MTKRELEKKIDGIIVESLFKKGGTKSPRQALLEIGATEEIENFRYKIGKFIIIVNGMNYEIHTKDITKISEARKYYDYIAEKKIAYNYLFSNGHINGMNLERILQSIDKYDIEKLKKYDVDIIKSCIVENYESYMKKPFIAGTFNEIAENLVI
jgi:hypothetical protein